MKLGVKRITMIVVRSNPNKQLIKAEKRMLFSMNRFFFDFQK
jgi:hypothetical protein